MRTDFTRNRQTPKQVKLRAEQAGFSILEMLIASAIMMVGIISVVQLVPASLQLNASNRLDTMATVIAQRELDQMLSQPSTRPSLPLRTRMGTRSAWLARVRREPPLSCWV